MSEPTLSIDRDELYRNCALQAGLVRLTTQPDDDGLNEVQDLHGPGDDVDRIPGGAWVTVEVWISNAEVQELLAQERRERAKAAAERAEREAELDALVDRIMGGRS